MWIVIVNDSIAEDSLVLPTAAANRESTEPLLVDFVGKWAEHNNVDLERMDVHCCTGEDHGHDPLVVVKEHGEHGKVLLEINCTEITHVIHAEKLTEHTGMISVQEVGEHVVPPLPEHPKTLH